MVIRVSLQVYLMSSSLQYGKLKLTKKPRKLHNMKNTWKMWGKPLKYDLMTKLLNAWLFTATVNDQLPVVAKLCSFFTFT